MTNPNDRVFLGNWKDPFMPSGEDSSGGLTKREYFAAMAMQGLMACPDIGGDEKIFATHSLKMADALIAKLNKDKKHGK